MKFFYLKYIITSCLSNVLTMMVFCVGVWYGPGSFWAPPATNKPTSLDDQTVMLFPSVLNATNVFLSWFRVYNVFNDVTVTWNNKTSYGLVLLSSTSYFVSVRCYSREENCRQTFAHSVIPRRTGLMGRCVKWIRFVSSVMGFHTSRIRCDSREQWAICFIAARSEDII